MKCYKAYGASTAARIMSSKEIDHLVARSLMKTLPTTNKPVAPADKANSEPTIKPVAKPTTKLVAKQRMPFEHLKA